MGQFTKIRLLSHTSKNMKLEATLVASALAQGAQANPVHYSDGDDEMLLAATGTPFPADTGNPLMGVCDCTFYTEHQWTGDSFTLQGAQTVDLSDSQYSAFNKKINSYQCFGMCCRIQLCAGECGSSTADSAMTPTQQESYHMGGKVQQIQLTEMNIDETECHGVTVYAGTYQTGASWWYPAPGQYLSNEIKRTDAGGIGLQAMASFVLEADTTTTMYKGQNLNKKGFTFQATGGQRLIVSKMSDYMAPPPNNNDPAFPANAMQSLSTDFNAIANARGYWAAAEGGNGNAVLQLYEGTTNSESQTLSKSVTNTISSTISAGFSFVSVSVTHTCSVTTSQSMTTQFSETISKTCTATSPAADNKNTDNLWTLYQWVTDVSQNDAGEQNSVWTTMSCLFVWLDDGLQPQCPYFECADGQCQTCLYGQSYPTGTAQDDSDVTEGEQMREDWINYDIYKNNIYDHLL